MYLVKSSEYGVIRNRNYTQVTVCIRMLWYALDLAFKIK